MQYETERLIIRSIGPEEASLYQIYIKENESFLSEWEPVRDKDYYSIENIKKRIEEMNLEDKNDTPTSRRFYIFKKDENQIIGEIGISNIVYGAFLSCHLGYKLSSEEINKGYITEALRKVIEICFKEMKLHRIEANILPKNIRSEKVVRKLGFKNEGKSEKYLRINGKWEDHNHWVLLNAEME